MPKPTEEQKKKQSRIFFRKGFKAPCGVSCPKRKLGCRSECQAWQEYEALRNEYYSKYLHQADQERRLRDYFYEVQYGGADKHGVIYRYQRDKSRRK